MTHTPDLFDVDQLEKGLLTRFNLNRGANLWVAYSGGRDSHVLLHALHQVRQRLPVNLTALHVDHGLNEQSSYWASHCESICKQLQIGFRCTALRLTASRGRSIEEVARQARYEWLKRNIGPGDKLLTAHHRRDQAETLLLQLLRGAGFAGLASMPISSKFGPGFHLRPLLSFSAQALADYAEKHELSWIEDASNIDLSFDRNYLREKILPLLGKRWSGAEKVLARSAGHLAEGMLLLEELAEQDMRIMQITQPVSSLDYGTVLSTDRLTEMSPGRQRNLLRYWIKVSGYRVPATRQLAEIEKSLINKKSGGGRVTWDQVQLHRHQDALILVPAVEIRNGDRSELPENWNLRDALALKQCGLEIIPRISRGQGIATKYLQSSSVDLRWRVGGERCRLPGRSHHHKLKKLYQSYRVPNWERQRIPLIYIDNTLAALPGYWVCHPFSAQPDETAVWFDLKLCVT